MTINSRIGLSFRRGGLYRDQNHLAPETTGSAPVPVEAGIRKGRDSSMSRKIFFVQWIWQACIKHSKRHLKYVQLLSSPSLDPAC